jgi:hypothetical protein
MSARAVRKKLIPIEAIGEMIVVLRGHRVMLDRDLAALYGVPVKRLNEQVKRNRDRFPADFMFQLTREEGEAERGPRSQIATLKGENGGMKRGRNLKYQPYAFTEHGAIMLANVLRSPAAVRASIQVVRAFVNMRRVLDTNQMLLRKVETIEQRVDGHDVELQEMLRVLRELLEPATPPKKNPIGFIAGRSRGGGA